MISCIFNNISCPPLIKLKQLENAFISFFVAIGDAYAWLRGCNSSSTRIQETSRKYLDLKDEQDRLGTEIEFEQSFLNECRLKIENLNRIAQLWAKELHSLFPKEETLTSEGAAEQKEKKWNEIIDRVKTMKPTSDNELSMQKGMQVVKPLIEAYLKERNIDGKGFLAKTDFLISETQTLAEIAKTFRERADNQKRHLNSIEQQRKKFTKQIDKWSCVEKSFFDSILKRNLHSPQAALPLEDSEVESAKIRQAAFAKADDNKRRLLFA